MTNRSLDIGRSFTFTFDDQNWIVKVLIGGVVTLLSFLLIPLPILAGYYLAVVRNTAKGNDLPLPEWDDFGRYFSEGLQMILGALVYFLPVIVIACGFGILIGVTAESSGGGDAEGAVGLFALCFQCLIFLLSLAIGIVLPAAILRFAATGRMASMFEFGAIWRFIQENAGNYIIAILLSWVAQIVASVAALFTCGLGSPWTSWWSTLVGAHLLGQVWRNAKGSLGGTFDTNDDLPPLSSEMPL